MQQHSGGNANVAESSDKTVSELFSGRLTLEQALQKLRTRLLDLSARNRLLSYKHPKGRSIQFVDEPSLTHVFNRLEDGKAFVIKYIPDPPTDSYTSKRPDVKNYAESLGIDVNVAFPPSSCALSASKQTSRLQALYYPADLDKLCRKLATEARTIIEETGTNMLYLVFGFLEFYDREDSEKPMMAPLLAVPVALEKGQIDPDTRTYQYSIVYSGEDIHENQTLREKLSQDLALQLPKYEEDDDLGTYFAKIQKAVLNKKRWKVHYQLTLGFLSFGKLAIWDDLDPKKWPGLLGHPLLKNIFSGGSGKGAGHTSEDYEIDKHPQGELPVIYDADSSQHSAIIDVLSGKNLVINGPPGTGKSQTITNIIAAGLQSGKKILFVSEKLAALEVVRHRLNQANLGHFCLELHSHKSQKKKLLSDLQDRLDEKFRAPQQLQDKVSTLKRHRKQLNRYAELMASRVGNELGLTVYEVFWKTELRRQKIGDLTQAVQSLFLKDANVWTFDEIEYRRSKLEAMGQIFDAIGSYDPSHPWWGFVPRPLAPGDENAIGRIIAEAHKQVEVLHQLVTEYTDKTELSKESSLESLLRLNQAFAVLPVPPEILQGPLLPRVFSSDDSLGKHNQALLSDVIRRVERAREFNAKAEGVLSSTCDITYDLAEPLVNSCTNLLAPEAFSMPLNVLEDDVTRAEQALSHFERITANTSYSHLPIQVSSLTSLNDKLKATAPLNLLGQPVRTIREGAVRLSSEVSRFGLSFTRIADIAKQRGIAFDGSPVCLAALSHPDGIGGVVPGASVDDLTVAKAQEASKRILANLSLAELDKVQLALHSIHECIARLLYEIDGYAKQVGLPFDGTPKALSHIGVLGKISSQAPADLLDYRRQSLAHPRVPELLKTAQTDYELERSRRDSLAAEFYLDSLPSQDELKAIVRVFRRGDGLFNFLNSEWRAAKRLFNGISKTKQKRKAADYEERITSILNWIGHRNSFAGNDEFKQAFGALFKGTETDFAKIRRIHTWYAESQVEMLKLPGLIDLVDLSLLDARKLSQLAALSSRIQTLTTELSECQSQTRALLGTEASRLENTLSQSGWTAFSETILKVGDGLKGEISFLGQYVKPEVSPKRAVELLTAKFALVAAKEDFDALIHGPETIQEQVESFLPGVSSIVCSNWEDYLKQLLNLAHASSTLGESLAEYGDENHTAQEIKSFFEAKLGLDSALEEFATLPLHANEQDWKAYGLLAHTLVGAASKLVLLLGPAGDPGKTTKEVMLGLEARKGAVDIVEGIASDSAVTAMLQELFQGLETNLDSLSATLSWGKAVVSNETIRHSSLRKVLMSSDAADNFTWAKAQLAQVAALRDRVEEALHKLGEFGQFTWGVWNTIEGLQTFSSRLLERMLSVSANVEAVLPWAKYNNERFECGKLGLGDFIAGLEGRTIPPSAVGSIFEFVAYRSIGRGIYKSLPELEGFVGAKHEKGRAEFIALDNEIISLTGKSFAHEINKAKKVPDGESGYRVSDYTEMFLLHHEMGKQKKHIPIRQLVKRAGRAIQALKPCFMMGPMSVAQYLEQGAVEFDMIVMDEASQLRPEEALGAIARGKQLVVVGDPNQLPPTNFFDRLMDGDDDEDDETAAVLGGSESILDICQQLFHPVRTLRWHYRSQHESLIAFSNHHFYKGKLVVFPSPFDRNNRLGVRYRHIRNGVYKDRQNIPEALRVVDAVVEHMMKYQEESLGVVTLNQTQRDLIEDLLDKKLRNIEEAQTYISKWDEEGWPFFVKNLENVQGDERDVIFISTTFGKAPGTDKPRQNFGPISRPDGWRRLNVLFTRARRKVELFTSMLPEDIVQDVKTPAGTLALKNYLDFAKRGILTTTDITGREPDSDFEISVGDMLRNRGYEVVPQLGVAGFFIDLAVRNPDRPGEFLAAIECDGATYHSSNSARDRDRIRQTILESLGWKDRIWRIWSTDWFYNPRRESERLLDYLEERRRIVSSEPAPEYEFDQELYESESEQPISEEEGVDEAAEPTISTSTEDLFVEVGDRVTYCFIDKPDERYSVMIVDSDSNPKLNLVNEHTALAQALLDCTVGDEPQLEFKGGEPRKLRVLKIHRQEALGL